MLRRASRWARQERVELCTQSSPRLPGEWGSQAWSLSEQLGREGVEQAWPQRGLFPSLRPPPSAGDPASPAPAAQHGGPVPAADVRGPAAAPHAADGGPAAAAPQQRPAPEPRSCAAGKMTSQEHRRCPRRKGQEKQALHACAHAFSYRVLTEPLRSGCDRHPESSRQMRKEVLRG